ncbi:MAG TPA: FAD-dependent oxidoreductase [Candidatus Borkfalkia faecipullorum]|uniref:FAD-dependent oxidoreductase n=1 Tax=Candidatus Borkfalkia faecipullorum TaxID=2838510 RepID=A0A9D1V7Q6_9FIRM|nr:FAD-dependent oxidoreductase [Candidatus Borkfalkia faecipullorum]
MEYVIIGNSTAGIAAAESIRKLDQAGSITILSDEAFPTYGRPLISYFLLGKTDAAHMNYRPADFYRKNNIRTMFSVRAEHIDTAKKQVLLQGGKKVKYDKLLVATGSRPFVPPMEGLDKNEYFTFMTYADALALEKQLAPEKNVLIVGAGLIGLKCLEGIADRVGKVTVVDMAPHILPSILDDYGASIIQEQLEKHGAEFYLSDSVASFEKGVAHLKSGATVPFDILVVAAGVRPNVELVKEAGGKVGRGILTNDRQETSLKDVYAAGDCTESYDITCGQSRILALLPNAQFQGSCAGTNMAGGEAHFTNAVPMNAIGFFGSHVLTAGSYFGDTYVEKEGETYKKLFFDGDKLNGFILIDLPERAGIYTSLLRNQTSLSEVDFEALKKDPGLLAFSEAFREQKLARKV